MGLKLSEVLDLCEQGRDCEYREVKTKPHFIGATYELTQANMNNLIRQLEEYMSKEKR